MVDSIFKKVTSYILIASVFITGPSFTDVPFSVFWFLPVYILFLVYATIVYGKINVNLIFAIVVLTFYSLLTMKSNPEMVVKQLVNITVALLVFYNFILHENFDIHEILRKYVQFSKLMLVIGFFQVILFIIGMRDIFLGVFPFLRHTNISERFQSLSDEPSFIALTFIPVVFVALHNLFYNTRYIIGRGWSLLFIAGYVMTLSSAAFLSLILMGLFLYLKTLTMEKAVLALAFCLTIVAMAVFSYNRIEYFKVRVDDTLYGMTQDITSPQVYETVNLSTYAFLSNAYVTRQALDEHPATGRGLGTHQVNYEKYLPEHMKTYSRLNYKDANSLALRLLSETGIIGAITFVVFLFAFKIRAGAIKGDEFLWIVNTAIFVMALIILLRNGNYTSSGKMMFMLLYYYSYRFYFKASSATLRPAGSASGKI